MKGGWRSPKGNGARRYICESRKRNANKRDTQKKRKAHLKNRRRARGLKVDGCRIGLMRRGSSSLSVVVVHGGNATLRAHMERVPEKKWASLSLYSVSVGWLYRYAADVVLYLGSSMPPLARCGGRPSAARAYLADDNLSPSVRRRGGRLARFSCGYIYSGVTRNQLHRWAVVCVLTGEVVRDGAVVCVWEAYTTKLEHTSTSFVRRLVSRLPKRTCSRAAVLMACAFWLCCLEPLAAFILPSAVWLCIRRCHVDSVLEVRSLCSSF